MPAIKNHLFERAPARDLKGQGKASHQTAASRPMSCGFCRLGFSWDVAVWRPQLSLAGMARSYKVVATTRLGADPVYRTERLSTSTRCIRPRDQEPKNPPVGAGHARDQELPVGAGHARDQP